MGLEPPLHQRAQPAPDPVPDHRPPDRPGNDESHPRDLTAVGRDLDAEGPGRGAGAPLADGGEGPRPAEAMTPLHRDAHRTGAGVSCLRPFRRRALITCRPPGVDIRIRKPWVFLR